MPIDRCDGCGIGLADRSTPFVSEELRSALGMICRLVRTAENERSSVSEILPASSGWAEPHAFLDAFLGLAKPMKVHASNEDDDGQPIGLPRTCQAIPTWPTGQQNIEFEAARTGQSLPPLLQSYAATGADPAIRAAQAECNGTTVLVPSACRTNSIGRGNQRGIRDFTSGRRPSPLGAGNSPRNPEIPRSWGTGCFPLSRCKNCSHSPRHGKPV